MRQILFIAGWQFQKFRLEELIVTQKNKAISYWYYLPEGLPTPALEFSKDCQDLLPCWPAVTQQYYLTRLLYTKYLM